VNWLVQLGIVKNAKPNQHGVFEAKIAEVASRIMCLMISLSVDQI
jgi:hypothetical protein